MIQDIRSVVDRAVTGDPVAFGELYDHYVGDVYRYLRGRVSDEHTAEDLTADTFLRALRGIRSYIWQGAGIGPWLIRIAQRVMVDYYRLARNREIPVDNAVVDQVDTGPQPEHAGMVAHEYGALLPALLALAPLERETLILRHLADRDPAEVAAALGSTPARIKVTHYRAVRTLKRRWAG